MNRMNFTKTAEKMKLIESEHTFSAQQLKDILEKLDTLGESVLREKLFGDEYIDTPGNFAEEKEDYEDIFEYDKANMGAVDYSKLITWLSANKDKVMAFMGWK